MTVINANAGGTINVSLGDQRGVPPDVELIDNVSSFVLILDGSSSSSGSSQSSASSGSSGSGGSGGSGLSSGSSGSSGGPGGGPGSCDDPALPLGNVPQTNAALITSNSIQPGNPLGNAPQVLGNLFLGAYIGQYGLYGNALPSGVGDLPPVCSGGGPGTCDASQGNMPTAQTF